MTEPIGALSARALRGAWRAQAPRSPLTLTELERLVPLALANGLSGLLWRTLAERPDLAGSSAGERLHEAWLRHVIQAGVHRRRLAATLEVLGPLDEILFVKGPTLAERYPQPGLRPFGDVDLAPAAHRLVAVELALDARPRGTDWVPVDTSHLFLRADGTPHATLLDRSLPGPHGVRVLGEEDTLRLVPMHFIVSCGWKLLALCDVAMLLENARDVDWDLVLGGRRPDWVILAAGLAETLVGADLRHTPLHGASARVPSWVLDQVVRRFSHTAHTLDLYSALAQATGPREVARAFRERWLSDPLFVTCRYGLPIRSRRPYAWQVLDTGRRVQRGATRRWPQTATPSR